MGGHGDDIFETLVRDEPGAVNDPHHLAALVKKRSHGQNPALTFLSHQTLLSQVAEPAQVQAQVRELARTSLQAYAGMRFLDLAPDAMRLPSTLGKTILGDRNENLSSVLQANCGDAKRKQALSHWLQELTPMDAEGFEFTADAAGRVLLILLKKGAHRTTAVSASECTLRFLGVETRAESLRHLENRAKERLGSSRSLPGENARQELEILVLAGHRLPRGWRWPDIRREIHPNEKYFGPCATSRGLDNEPEGGRRTLAQEAARQYKKRVPTRCPEDIVGLESRVADWLGAR